MAKKDGAKARLEEAVKELESAISRMAERNGATPNGVERPQQQVESLDLDLQKSRAENTRLSAELTRSKEVNTDLQSAMHDIAIRLDSAIDTVQDLLDE